MKVLKKLELNLEAFYVATNVLKGKEKQRENEDRQITPKSLNYPTQNKFGQAGNTFLRDSRCQLLSQLQEKASPKHASMPFQVLILSTRNFFSF